MAPAVTQRANTTCWEWWHGRTLGTLLEQVLLSDRSVQLTKAESCTVVLRRMCFGIAQLLQ